jgi:hypothetical protein
MFQVLENLLIKIKNKISLQFMIMEIFSDFFYIIFLYDLLSKSESYR